MKITCTNYDRNGKKTGVYFPFDGPIKRPLCTLRMAASGGVDISYELDDEFGYTQIHTIELDRDDIELINNTKL